MKKELPSDWKEVRLGDICDINVNSLRESTNENYQFKYIDLSSVKNGIIDFPNNYITFKNAPSRARRIIKIDDVIMATVRPNLKGFAYISFDPKEYICSTGFAVLTSKSEICMKYIYQILYANYIEKQISNMLVGSNYPALNTSDILNIKILLPPLYEQKRIADILSTFDDLIENLNKLIEKKELYKKGVMQRVLTGEVRFNGFTDEWENVKLKDILIVGSKDRVLDTSKYKKITIKLHNKGIEFSNIERKMADKRPFYIRKKDEIIIGKQNYFNGSIAIVGEEFDNTICSNAIMSFTVNKNCNNKFIYFLLSRKSYMQKYYHLANGTGQKELSESDFLNFNLLIPRLEEQNKIAELLTLIDKDIEILKQLLHLRKLQKKGVMQKLLTGEVRV